MICRPPCHPDDPDDFPAGMEPLDESRSNGAAANARLTRVFDSGSDDGGESWQW